MSTGTYGSYIICLYICVIIVVCVCVCIYRDCVLDAQALESALNCVTVELVEECVCDTVRVMGRETLRQLKQEKKAKLDSIRLECLLLRTQKYWHRLAHTHTQSD